MAFAKNGEPNAKRVWNSRRDFLYHDAIEAILKTFGRRVRFFRKKRNYTQAVLAALADLHRSTISAIERGRRDAFLDTIYKLAGALQVYPYELVEQPVPDCGPALPFPVLLNARVPSWKDQCVACAGKRESFTVRLAEEEDSLFLEAFTAHFGYAATTVGRVIHLLPVDRPPVQIVAVA